MTDAFANSNAIYEPIIKFKMVAEDGSWDCDTQAEKSLYDAAAIFVARRMNIYQVDAKSSFEHKVFRTQSIAKNTLAALDLELTNATA